MKKKKNQKTNNKKEPVVDTTIIEHMACLEVNRLILQPPFHLVSDIQWNDKGVSFDGDIEVYNSQKIEKNNFVDKVPVQVKGTTTPKKVYSSGKIRHSVKKDDLEVYYKHGRGVLYFVVTIIPISYKTQAYYHMLAPLDIKGLLLELERSGNESITIDFSELKKGSLEKICHGMIHTVKKQPLQYIEANEEMDFTHYQVEFVNVDADSFNIFETTAYIYGFNSDSIGKPVEATKVTEVRKDHTESVSLNNEENCIKYYTLETEKEYTINIENTLIIKYDKEKKTGSFSLGRVRTLSSYIKCLKLLNHYKIHNKFPFQNFSLQGNIQKGDSFLNVEERIGRYTELIEVCNQIGISENYEFSDSEDLASVFGSIISIFKNKQYNLINVQDPNDLSETLLHEIRISDYIKVKLLYTKGKFVSFYSKEALGIIGGLLPLEAMAAKFEESDELPEDWQNYFLKISIYATQKIEDMVEDANFDFDIVNLSFLEEYHDVRTDRGLNIQLDYMRYYEKTKDARYLELVLKLNNQHLVTFPQDDTAKINIYLVKLMRGLELTEEEQDVIWDIKEKSSKKEESQIRFACEVLLKEKPSAKRVFNSLDEEEKERMMSFPIYHYYEKLE